MKTAAKASGVFEFLFICGITLPLLLVPAPFIKGVLGGLELAAGIFIPAMLPFYFLTSFLLNSPARYIAEKLMRPVARLLRLPQSSASVILTGIIGGYPAGAMSAASLVKDGSISRADASRLMMFCVNAGPGFIVYSAGVCMAGSLKAGFVLLFSLLFASLTIALAVKPRKKNVSLAKTPNSRSSVNTPKPITKASAAFSRAVTSSASACLAGAAAIALFGGFTGFLSYLLNQAQTLAPSTRHTLRTIILCILEVTGGCSSVSSQGGAFTIPILAAVMGFGGLCVIVQLLMFCEGFAGFRQILFSRAIHAALSFSYAVIFSRLFNITARPRETAETVAALRQGQIPTAMILLFFSFVMCAAPLIQNRKKMPIAKKTSRDYTVRGARASSKDNNNSIG